MIWKWWLSSVYVVSYRSAFDEVKILGIFSNFERAATVVDRLIQFREITPSEIICVHRTVLNCTTYEGLRDQCLKVTAHTGITFSRGRYEKLYSKVQKEKKRRTVEL
jgi:hypothetical protein